MPLSVISGAMSKKLQDISRLYLDTNIFIYFLEGNRKFNDAVERVFQICEEFDIAVFTSEITVTECLVGPYKQKNTELIQKYELFFQNTGGAISVVPVESRILLETPMNAAMFGLKLVDAIHVTTALACSCDGFLTNDDGIGPLNNDLSVLYLSNNII